MVLAVLGQVLAEVTTVTETSSMQGRRVIAVTDMEASSVVARAARPKSGVPDVSRAAHPDAEQVDI